MRVLAIALIVAVATAEAKPLTLEAYSEGLVLALTKGAKLKEVDRYTPPGDVKPSHTVRIFKTLDSYWYVSDGFGFIRQPGSVAGSEAFNAWNYDTISLPEEVYGLRYFVLRPGAEVKMPRGDHKEQMVSIFTIIPITAEERIQVANVGREKARAWVEKRAVESPAAMLARWKLTPIR